MSYRDKHDSGLQTCTISSYYVQAVRTESRYRRQFGSNSLLILLCLKLSSSTPEWSHAVVACIQLGALGTGCHPGSETYVLLPGQQKLYVRRSHMLPEPYHDELHTFRKETERRRHCGNEGWIRAVAESQ